MIVSDNVRFNVRKRLVHYTSWVVSYVPQCWERSFPPLCLFYGPLLSFWGLQGLLPLSLDLPTIDPATASTSLRPWWLNITALCNNQLIHRLSSLSSWLVYSPGTSHTSISRFSDHRPESIHFILFLSAASRCSSGLCSGSSSLHSLPHSTQLVRSSVDHHLYADGNQLIIFLFLHGFSQNVSY